MHYFCLLFFVFTIFCELLLNQPIDLTSVSITLFDEYFSAIFKNITYALYKQNRPWRDGWNVYMKKKSHQSEISVLWTWDPC